MKRSLILLFHQFLATMGVLLWALVLTNVALEIPKLWGRVFLMSDLWRVLSVAPYYPVQIVIGVMCGWLVRQRFGHKVMLWVWVFPLFSLVCAMLAETPTYTSVIVPGATLPAYASKLSHFFGSGCRLEDHCYDQTGFTLPFYAAVAYSVGAWFAQRFPIRSRSIRGVIFVVVGAIGISVLLETAISAVAYFGQGWSWLVMLVACVQAAMGVSLIFFALRAGRGGHWIDWGAPTTSSKETGRVAHPLRRF
jgi:hypothetical protein